MDLQVKAFPTPSYACDWNFLEEVPGTLPAVEILSHPPATPGLVTSDAGFLDSPDTEVIAGGVHMKGPGYIAIGRQGHFLLWGFDGSPGDMTETGREVFLNAVAYISRFRGAPVLALRKVPPRDSLGISLGFLELDDPTDRPRLLEREFGSEVPQGARAERASRKAWFLENRPYFRYEGTEEKGRFVVDEDAKAWAIPNSDVRLLERAVSNLQSGTDTERSRRVLAHYTEQNFAEAGQWRAWLDSAKSSLFFSDWNGYRFFPANSSSAGAGGAVAGGGRALAPVEKGPVKLAVTAQHGSGGVVAHVAVTLAPGFHLYSPPRSPEIAVDVRLAPGSGYSMQTAPRFPSSVDGLLRGSFTIDVPLRGDASRVDLLMGFQACNDQVCLPPVSDLKLSAPVAR